MKSQILTIVLLIFSITTIDAQIKKPAVSVKTNKVKMVKTVQGIKVDLTKIKTSADFNKLKIPVSQISKEKLNAKPINTWKITPLKSKDGQLELESLFGVVTKSHWQTGIELKSYDPNFTNLSSNFPLSIKFRVFGGVEYLLKLKDQMKNRYGYVYVAIRDVDGRHSFINRVEFDRNNELYYPFYEERSKDVIIDVSFVSTNASGEKIDYKCLKLSEIEINVQGFESFQYTLSQNTLSISDGSSTLQLIKNESAPTSEDWIQELSVLSEGDAPWSGDVDIAFTYDKTKIVYGMNDTSTYIPFIDPVTFTEVGLFGTPNIAKVVEVEKFEIPDRYLFQSNGNSNLIRVSSIDGSGTPFNLEVETKIVGIASVDPNYLWVASNDDEGSLNLVNVADNTIDQTIPLGFYNVNGLDYQNGFLYVDDGVYLHKCQTTPTFKAIASYKVPNFGMQGIAFDGTNFWASAFDDTESSYKLIKTSLTL